MRAVEKIWTVAYHIHEAQKLAPKGKPCLLHSQAIWKLVGQIDAEYVLEKLEKDEKVIRVINKPYFRASTPERKYCYQIEVLPTFTQYLGRLHSQYTVGLDHLDDYALLRVYDVILDLRNELALTPGNTVTIPVMPPVIRFQTLFPADTIGLRDQYSQQRWKCIEFLGHVGVLTEYEENESPHRWLGTITVTVNRIEFYRAYEKLRDKYRQAFGSKSADEIVLLPRPIFDEREGAIHFDGKKCEIVIGSVEYYICLLSFEKFGEKIEELKVIDESGKRDTKRMVYDAHRRLNDKAKSDLDIPQLFGYGSARVWVRAEQFEPEKKQEKQPERVSHM